MAREKGYYRFHLQPAEADLQPEGQDETTWRCTVTWPTFYLLPEGGRFPSGWVLVSARIQRRGADKSAFLQADAATERIVHPIPVTRRGRVAQLIWLPPDVRRLIWQPMQSTGVFEQHDFCMLSVGPTRRLLHRLERIATMLFRQGIRKCRRSGLSVRRTLVDLHHAYLAASNLLAHAPAPDYQEIVERFQSLAACDRRTMALHVSEWSSRPDFELLLRVDSPVLGFLERGIASVRHQVYTHWRLNLMVRGQLDAAQLATVRAAMANDPRIRLVVLDREDGWADAANAVFHEATGGFLAVLGQHDCLSPVALFMCAMELVRSPKTAILYTDEDETDAEGRRLNPWHKPDWNPELILRRNYCSGLTIYKLQRVEALGGFRSGFPGAEEHDLVLRLLDSGQDLPVRHLPAIVYHRAVPAGTSGPRDVRFDPAWESGRRALSEHFLRRGIAAAVLPAGLPQTYRVRYAVTDQQPLVSILVPTRNNFTLLRRCLESVLERTEYRNFEILVIDNHSTELEVLEHLRQLSLHPQVRILEYRQPFNFSAINNFAAAQAGGEVLCLLNDDTEVIAGEWLAEMLGLLRQERVGVVGAKLLYPDGSLQHAGIVLGVGSVAGHAHQFLPRESPGYFGRAVLAQDVSAVTGACLMVRRSLYTALGGLDERHLAVAFNDVDFCLRVRKAGYRVVWTPYALLYHHESVSRGQVDVKTARFRRERNYMKRRWKRELARDPFYSPHLSRERADYSLSHAPEFDWVRAKQTCD